MSTSAILSGVVLGAVFGFVLQRGRFCLNAAFRDVIYIRNFTLLRAYVLALVIAVIGSNLLEQFGIVSLDQGRQEFAWLANVLGGYLFGVGMVLAGGCASGTWYRVGEGLVGSWMAALGFMIGAAAMKNGALASFNDHLRGFVIAPGMTPTINGLIGANRWVIVLIITAAGLAFILSARTSYASGRAEYHWRTTGILVGLLIVSGWYASTLTAGAATGISFTAPSAALIGSVTAGRGWDWGVALLAGVPLGAFLSARRAHEFSWRAPRANVMVQQLSGGLIMGAGGMLAGGCPIGHGLTGLSTLSLASLVSMVFIILGCWSMVYLLFMRTPSEN